MKKETKSTPMRRVFACNLDRLMLREGRRNSTLARALQVSRQIVSDWRQGESIPRREFQEAIAVALNCDLSDLWKAVMRDDEPEMIPVSKWAKKVGLTSSRARNLATRGMLPGVIIGDVILVPLNTQVPDYSKLTVMRAGQLWQRSFAVNFTAIMHAKTISDRSLASLLQVPVRTVRVWQTGDVSPRREMIPAIAEAIGCQEDELLREPTVDEAAAFFATRLGLGESIAA